MEVDVVAIAVVSFNVGVFLLLLQVLKIALKLPRWVRIGQRFFEKRLAASQSLQNVPQQFDRLNQFIFDSNQKFAQLSRRLSLTTQLSRAIQLTQLRGWVSRRRRRR
ncbi:MAG: hypothetical protein AAF268_17125 [Cyanobacteria bacterium P01_A01_bin.3]